jgi:hypothetical protein
MLLTSPAANHDKDAAPVDRNGSDPCEVNIVTNGVLS